MPFLTNARIDIFDHLKQRVQQRLRKFCPLIVILKYMTMLSGREIKLHYSVLRFADTKFGTIRTHTWPELGNTRELGVPHKKKTGPKISTYRVRRV